MAKNKYKLIIAIILIYIILEFINYNKYKKKVKYFNNNFPLSDFITSSDELKKNNEFQKYLKKNILQLNTNRSREIFKLFYNINNDNELTDEKILEFIKQSPSTNFSNNKILNYKIDSMYKPLFLYWIMCIFFFIGKIIFFINGFKLEQYDICEENYNIWIYNVPNTKPIIFFPGLGIGALQYLYMAKNLNRTIYMIEVPNINCITTITSNYMTQQTLKKIVLENILYKYHKTINNKIDYTLMGHSFGTIIASVFHNSLIHESKSCMVELYFPSNFILIDPVSIVENYMENIILPFIKITDYFKFSKLNRPKINIFLWTIIMYYAIKDINFQIYCKRYYIPHQGTLWKHHDNIKYLYILGSNDFLINNKINVELLKKNKTENCKIHLVENGNHLDCILGNNHIFEIIKEHL